MLQNDDDRSTNKTWLKSVRQSVDSIYLSTTRRGLSTATTLRRLYSGASLVRWFPNQLRWRRAAGTHREWTMVVNETSLNPHWTRYVTPARLRSAARAALPRTTISPPEKLMSVAVSKIRLLSQVSSYLFVHWHKYGYLLSARQMRWAKCRYEIVFSRVDASSVCLRNFFKATHEKLM